MSEKMIGLVIASMDSESSLELYNGIISTAQKYDFSTQGYVINPSKSSSSEYNENEFFMLETIDFSDYDGLIVALDTISSTKTKALIRKNLESANIPIIAVDCDIPHSFKINTNNYESVKKMIYHVHKVHGRNKINYISGPGDNAESNIRLNAYRQAMIELGLPFENRIFEGTFFVEDGRNALDFFQQNEISRDYDAIICGNDMAAISTICELIKAGKRVPEDVIVTGFDDVMDAIKIVPSLSTISKNIYEVGVLAIQLLYDYWTGKTVSPVNHIESKNIYRCSCGCEQDCERNKSVENWYIHNFTFTQLFHVYNRSFMEEGISCNSFGEFLTIVKEFALKVNPEQFSLYISADMAKVFEIEDYPGIIMTDMDGGKYELKNVLFYSSGKFIPIEILGNNKEMEFHPETFVETLKRLPAVQILNSPLHFKDKKIGLVVFSNSKFPLMPELYCNWRNTMNAIINSIYHKMMLTHLYRTDSLTGLYNRFGLEKYWEKYVSISNAIKRDICILFVDMNGLKQINDGFGHEEGDFAIKFVGSKLKDIEAPRLKAFRFGGDEFILLGVGYTRNQIDYLIKMFNESVESSQLSSNKKYHISVSIGIYMRSYDSEEDMEKCMILADEDMYKSKQELKKQ